MFALAPLPKNSIYNRFLFLIVLYFSIHLLVRLLLTHTLEIDEAEQVFFSQQLLWGYNQQPPLYTWIIIFLTHLFGHHLFSIIIFRFILLIGIFCMVFNISRKYVKGIEIPVITCLSLLLFFQLSIESLRQTHTVMVTFGVVYLLYSLLQLVKRPGITNYILFGTAITFGMLSKYNFIIPLASLLISACLDPVYRKVIFNKKIAISFVVFALLISKHAIWLSQNLSATSKETIEDLAASNHSSFLYIILLNTWALLKGILSFGGIFLVSVLIIFKGKISFIFKKDRSGFIHFLGKFFLISFILLWVILLLTKATNAHERWIQPLFFLVPVYIFIKYDRSKTRIIKLNRLRNILYTVSVLILMYVIISISLGPYLGFTERINRPYKTFSNYLKEQKILVNDTNLIISDATDIAGNIKLQFNDHPVEILNPTDCQTFFTPQAIYNTKNLLLIGSQKNNEDLINCIKKNYKRSFTKKHYKKEFLFKYSTSQYYTFYYTSIQFYNK